MNVKPGRLVAILLSLAALPPVAEAEHDFWSAAKNLGFDAAQRYVTKDSLDIDYEKFLWGLQLTIEGDVDLAEKIFNELAFSSRDSAVADNALVVLGELWFLKNRWQAFVATEPYMAPTENNAFALVRSFAGVPEESLYFPDDPVELPMKLSITGCPVIEVEINGQKKRLWLDTGASISTLTTKLAAECGIKPLSEERASALTGTTKTVDIQAAVIDSLKIDELIIHNHPATIIDSEDLEFKLAGVTILRVDGIIGYNAVKNMDIEIDYVRKLLTLRKPIVQTDVKRNLFWLGVPIVRLTSSDGVPLQFFLDTGASKTNLLEGIFEKIDFTNVRTKKVLIGSAGGIQRFEAKKVPRLTLMLDGQALNIRNLVTVLAPIKPFVRLDGILGADAFLGRVVHIDHTNGRFEISPHNFTE